MLNAIIIWSLGHRFLVIALTLVLIATGVRTLLRLPVDAFPDTTPVQVQVNTTAPALSPLEIEQQITFPVEQAISGLKGLTEVRSLSRFGLSQVTVIFEDGVDVYFARQLVMERLGTVDLPDGLPAPEMGPVAGELGDGDIVIAAGKVVLARGRPGPGHATRYEYVAAAVNCSPADSGAGSDAKFVSYSSAIVCSSMGISLSAL